MPAELTGDLLTALTGAAFAPLPDRAFLRITGPDATRWLNGMVTNSIQALTPGEGNYNFLLNAQGRIQGDATIYREPDTAEPAFLLETDASQLEPIQQLLDRFIIMDDVELSPVHEGNHALLISGAQPGSKLLPTGLPSITPLHLVHAATPAGPLLLTAPFSGHTVAHGDAMTLAALRTSLLQRGFVELSPATLEALRLLEARPRYGTDIRNTDTAKDLPQETNQPHALHFSKGCYVGQEIVERIRSRGQVHRLLTPFRLEGTAPGSLPAPLTANGKPAGELTSAAPVSTTEGELWLALGYARREFLDAHTPLEYAGGIAHPRVAGSLT